MTGPSPARLPERLRDARRSLTVTFGVLLGLILLLLVVGIGVSRAVHQSATEEYVEDAIPLKAAVQDLVTQMVNQQSSVRAFLLTEDDTKLVVYLGARRGVEADLAYIRDNLDGHPVMANLLAQAEPQIEKLQAFYEEQIALGRAGAQSLEQAREATTVGERDFAAFRATAARMVADTDAFVEDARDDQERLTNVLTVTLVILGALAAVVALRLSWVMRRRIADLLSDLDAERARSAEAAVRASALQRVTAALAPALDDEAVLQALAGEASAAAGIDEVVLASPGPGGQFLERRSLGGETAELDRRIPIEEDLPLSRVARTGEPEFHATVEDLVAANPEAVAVTPAIPGASWAVLPIRAGVRGRGALGLRFDEGRRFDEGERTFLLTLTDQAALALERVRLHQQQQEIAHVLQQSLLPRALPELEGVALAARYVTGQSGQEVGGDFYDVFEDRSGRLSVMIGDACGKGPEAVALTALARYTVRAVADGVSGPAEALGRLNRAMRDQGFGTLFLTAAHLTLEPRGDGAVRVTASRAGHPFPLVVRRDGHVEELGGPGTILGVFDDPPLADVTTDLAPGDTVLAFTDGLTEARQGTALLGDEDLRRAASACAGLGVEEAASHLLGVAAAFAHGALRDDVALVVVRITPA
ncbi:MAG: SpoIIE family protein phosphatase [Thermoleophilia bacterium]